MQQAQAAVLLLISEGLCVEKAAMVKTCNTLEGIKHAGLMCMFFSGRNSRCL